MKYFSSDDREAIKEFMIVNRAHLIELVQPLIDHRKDLLANNGIEFHKEINDQFIDMVIRVFTNEIAQRLALTTEQILVILTAIDIDYYLSIEEALNVTNSTK